MKNNHGTLRVQTENDIPSTVPQQFALGPFTVQASPNFYEVYTRYTIMAGGVPVRDQISYPEVEDGWQGLAFAKANHLLTEEQLAVVKNFRTHHGH